MNINLEGRTKLDFFTELYEKAEAVASAKWEEMRQHFDQYRGSKVIDGSSVEAKVVRNITYELIESQVTSYIPNPSVSPKMWSEKNERNAKSAEVFLRNKRDELPFERQNDMDERYTPIYGGSVWLVEWDDSIRTHNTVGDIKVTCLAPTKFVGQPHIYDIADMEYCFIKFDTTIEDIMRRYGVSITVAEDTHSEEGDDDTATLYVCYYKNDDDKVCEYVWSGDTELLDIEDYYSRKRYICKKCGKRKEICECGAKASDYELQSDEYEDVERDIMLSDGTRIPAMSPVIEDGQVKTEMRNMPVVDGNGNPVLDDSAGYIPVMAEQPIPVMERTRLPYYKPNTLPIVIRKNTSEEDSVFGQSDCEFIRPQQQTINKVESRILEKLMSGGVYPLVPDSFDAELDNTVFKKVFRCKQNEKGLFDRIDLTADISRDIAEADRVYDHAKRILGISDSFQGQYDGSAQSGKAKQLQIQQAQGRLDSKRQNKNTAYADMDRIMFEYYLAYADEPRPATYRDAYGRLQNMMFSRYDFIERDEAGEYYYNDGFLFSADATIDIEESRETMWEQNIKMFQMGAYGSPELPQSQLIFWQNMEQAHYPWSHENVERIREEIARQQQMAQMQGQLDDMQAELNAKEGYEEYLMGEVQKRGGVIGG